MARGQNYGSWHKACEQALGLRRSGEAESQGGLSAREQTTWILAGFHDGTSCRAVLH
jgi:hypothetical protein